jgi:hypothetical protein
MSYEQQVKLRADGSFQGRTSAVVFEQALIFKDDARPDIAALARRHLADAGEVLSIWMPYMAATPGFADHANDTSLITDGDLLAATQAHWPTVSNVFYADDGTPV